MRTQWKQTALATALHVSLCVFALPLVAAAQQGPVVQTWNVEAGSLQQAISRVMRQGRLTISYPSELVAGKTTRGLSGTLTPREALEQLLLGSGIEVEAINDTSFVLRRAGAGDLPKTVSPPSRSAPPAPPIGGQPARVEEPIEISPVVVTGTRIRGGSAPSPVITIGVENIREEGFTDLGEVIRNLPQNFAGGQNPEIPSANLLGAGLANQNLTGGSGVNLRGLGPDASLTLLNGHRMAYDGFSQAIDISAIPVEALDRIEIVADGSSAIYGSDAVGGVVNVILARDYEGITVGARYGTATDGGLTTREYTATAGTTWATGGLIATYKDESADPVYVNERAYTRHLLNPRTIFPESSLRSGLFSVHQSIGEGVELRLDALKASRKQNNYFLLSDSPQYYGLQPETKTEWASPSIEFRLRRDWTMSLSGTWGKNESVSHQTLFDAATGASSLRYNECYCNEVRMYELGAEGPLFRLSGGDARLAVGGGYRSNEFQVDNYLPQVNGLPDYQGEEGSRFIYGEVSLPLLGSASGIAGVNRLVLTAAARSEDYDSFGRVTTPQFGLIYGPSEDISIKGSWGKSFKAPTLYQMRYYVTALLYPAAALGATGYPPDATALYLVGGDQDLDPERARTWTASVALHPKALTNLEAELTWFNIDYSDRVVQPFANAAQGLSNPVYAPFVDYAPTAATQADVIANADGFLNYSGATYDPASVVAILRGRYVNVSRQRVKGADLSARYRFDLGAGQLSIRGSVTWLDSVQQLSPGQDSVQLSGTLFNPAKVNGRLGMVWHQGGLTASTFADYTDGVKDVVNAQAGASFTTFDATLRYANEQGAGAWSGLEIALSVQNVFDRDPPLHTPAPYVFALPYDPSNYSAIGRFMALSISKRW